MVQPDLSGQTHLLSIAALTGILAHVIEVQVGFALVSSTLLLWILAGLICQGFASDAETLDQISDKDQLDAFIPAILLLGLGFSFSGSAMVPRGPWISIAIAVWSILIVQGALRGPRSTPRRLASGSTLVDRISIDSSGNDQAAQYQSQNTGKEAFNAIGRPQTSWFRPILLVFIAVGIHLALSNSAISRPTEGLALVFFDRIVFLLALGAIVLSARTRAAGHPRGWIDRTRRVEGSRPE